MIDWDLLLYWMTHLGTGSWDAFKRAVARTADDTMDAAALIVPLRFQLSDLGFVDFFTNGSRRWQVLAPTLAGVEPAGTAILIGGRTPRLQDNVLTAAQRLGCAVSLQRNAESPTSVRVTGTAADLEQLAAETRIRFSPRHAHVLAAGLIPLFKKFENAQDETPPTNWQVQSFDLGSMSMVDGLRRNSACEYSPRRGLPRWYVHTRHRRVRPLSKREAIYVAAMLQDVRLLSYERDAFTLRTEASAPLPETYARVASLCSGRRPLINGRTLIYGDVPVSVASVLCVASGQPALAQSRRVAIP
jgi:hypothetical protein